MIIRETERRDLQALLDIYNYEVVHGVATLDLQPKSMEEWDVWFSEHNVENHPLLTAEVDGVAAGYASLSSYRAKEAFRSTVELSIYIDPKYRGRKVASSLLEEIIAMAKQDERTHLIVSVITSGNDASTRLHEKYGFTFCGRMHEVGLKHGKYQDIDNYELRV